MFTGIVEEVGTVASISRGQSRVKLRISSGIVIKGIAAGDSVSVNGVCLTVTAFDNRSFELDVVEESLSRSTLGGLKVGTKVNLERAVAADGRFGGHMVSGHIDGVGGVIRMLRRGNSTDIEINCPLNLLKYVIEKGSIAVDGVSLTVAGAGKTGFRVTLIPHTLRGTNLGSLRERDFVNLEVDMLGKYIEKNISALKRPASRVNEAFLKGAGFNV
jgi:riboflavin synthase